MKYLMKCGHVVYSRDIPICPICFGLNKDAELVEHEHFEEGSLNGRTARCVYCQNEVSSDFNLPFFKYRPGASYDEFYDGCYGWD